MDQRKLMAKIEGQGVDGDEGLILLYDIGEKASLVATSKENGDAEIIFDKSAAVRLGTALIDAFRNR